MTDPVDDILSNLTTIDLASAFLERLAEDIPTPTPDLEDRDITFAILGERAKSLYANFQHSLSSPAALGPLLAIRPLVELAILIKWISLDAAFHGFLWFADSEASELTHFDAIHKHSKTRGSPDPNVDPRHRTSKEVIRTEALSRLEAAGRDYGKHRILPSVIRMVEEVEKGIPGHKIAMRDAYEYAYRTLSPWEHTNASSFKATAERTTPGSWNWLGDRSAFHIEDIQAIAASMYAYVLEVIFSQLGSAANANLARTIRDYVVLHWVRSDRVRPPADKPDLSESE